jgi:hypothetical protein
MHAHKRHTCIHAYRCGADARNQDRLRDVIAGLSWVAGNVRETKRPSVVSISISGGRSTTLNRAVKVLGERYGVSVVVAAGNHNTDACNESPASERSTITVASSDRTDTRSAFSNFGSCVDIWAPGDRVTSGVSRRASSHHGV